MPIKTPPRTLVAGAAQAGGVGGRQQQQGRGDGERSHHIMGVVELCVGVVR